MNAKKIIQGTAIGLAGLFAVVTIVGFVLPRDVRISRSIVIGAPAEDIYPLIANLEDGWSRWSPFNEDAYGELELEYSGPEQGVGATQSRNSPESGDGTLTITKADPQRGVEMELSMMQESYKATGSLLCEPAGQKTKVTWTDEFDLGFSPYRRYFGLIADDALGEYFDQGLETLKREVEDP